MQTRSLEVPALRQARLERSFEPHVSPLNRWAEQVQAKSGRWVPFFDPEDGGVSARVLLLLETPGPAVSRTHFVSVDNPDGTAENLRCLLHLSGLRRRDVAVWNAVPWQMSAGVVVTPRPGQYADAVSLTRQVLGLLPDLRVVVLVGRHAGKVWPLIGSPLPTLACPHPSPQNVNSRRESAALALGTLVQAYKLVSETRKRATPASAE
ncbi:uracil-DNA glycosylase [Deinococcus planocerae]|uniref:uracil-DNA glycosylase n=1 Tax=Deinococcus planocerae TaxID=1737569 RepID=UPI0015E1049C|nr:uracil-DNA glycosylase [Deinococcus planocerae]